MELHRNLIEIIDSDLHPELEKLYAQEDSLHAKIISELLKNPEITSKEMLEKHEMSEGTFNKTLTLVKDILWNFNARYIQTTYDDIFVLRQMLLHGKVKNSMKFYNSLKKKFETTQQWDKLDCLYTEGLRHSQLTGDETMACSISKERQVNSIRLHNYTMVYSEIIPEMIRLESYKVKKFDQSYAYYIEELYQKSIKTGHHLLIHNALHIKYLLYSRFRNTPENVFSIVNAIKNNAEKYQDSMAPITYAIALNTYVNFLTIYRNFGSPETYLQPLKKIIHHGGLIAKVNLYFSMLEYSLFERKTNDALLWIAQLEQLEDDSKFSQYRYIMLAIKAFIDEDHRLFSQYFQLFYNDPAHLNFPDLEITLRLLEAIILLKKEEGDLASSRLSALRIFIGRNVDKERYDDERKIITILNKVNEGRKDVEEEITLLKASPYRNIHFIAATMHEWLLNKN